MKQYLGGLAALMLFAGTASAGDFPAVKVEKINDRIYAMLGPHDPPNKENGGYMNNNLVIIGNKGVILVDAGSHKDGNNRGQTTVSSQQGLANNRGQTTVSSQQGLVAKS